MKRPGRSEVVITLIIRDWVFLNSSVRKYSLKRGIIVIESNIPVTNDSFKKSYILFNELHLKTITKFKLVTS